MTDFFNKVIILGDFYINYRDDDNLEDFMEFNDIGLPLAYLSKEGICDINDEGRKYINETWDLFLAALSLEDTGFETLSDVFSKAEKNNEAE